MKFKEFHLKDARASHLKIQCSKDCLSSPQQGQYLGQLNYLISSHVVYIYLPNVQAYGSFPNLSDLSLKSKKKKK